MQAVMNNGRYLCIASPTIKRRDLSGYKKIITCKSCNYVDPNPHLTMTAQAGINTSHLHQGGWLLSTISNLRYCNCNITLQNSL